jgi:myo-inositol-1(or 4)-monophosphatase
MASTPISVSGLNARRAFAIELVREAGHLAEAMRRDAVRKTVEAKSANDFVTAADKAVEELIRLRIAEAFGDAVLGEEMGGEIADQTKPLWIVDPIDGTRNYIHGRSQWCVSLGFLDAGAPVLGLIYQPPLDHLYVAQTGLGASRNGVPLRVSGSVNADRPLVEVGMSNRRPFAEYLAAVERLMTAGIETRRCGSGALGLAQVASGENDGYLEMHINSWDVAAGIVLVTEAGGIVNDFFAGNGLRQGNPILAATPSLAERLAALVTANALASGFVA